MLVLTLGPGRQVRLDIGDGDEIVITMVATRGRKARIGIDAPDDVDIDRIKLDDPEEEHA